MILLDTLLKDGDIFLAPLCFIILLMFFSVLVKKYKDENIKRLFLKAFYFKMFCAVAFTFINSYYYRGGDTEMYYFCTQHLHKAVMDDVDNFYTIYMTKVINVKTPLMNYFIFTDSPYPDFEAMHSAGNFLVPKLALPIALVFNNSYMCIAMVFSFFALGGAIRLFKVLYHYFPQYQKEIAFAVLFLPSIGYWSSGLMKDPICFGCVGYIVYAIFNIFIRKRNYAGSLIWIAICGTLLYFMKPYILLSLLPAMVLWLFAEFNKVVENKTLRRIMAFMTFVIGGLLAVAMISYATSDESLQSFQLDAIAETSARQRDLYQDFGSKYEGSYYTIQSSNPVLLVLNGIVAALFRPFLWEINSPTALLSSLESTLFLWFTFLLIYRRGPGAFFRKPFSHPFLMMCFVFSIIFAAAVGSTALNFGSLSRYKIPCLPFYLSMVMILYREAGLIYPPWFKKLIGYRSQIKRTKQAF